MRDVHASTRSVDGFTHDCRAFLFDQIRLNPGINLSALDDRTAASLSTVRYHLRVLERSGAIRSEKRRGRRRYYRADFDLNELERAIREGPDPLLAAFERLDEPSGLELARELDRDPSTISYHLARLEDAGVVARKRDGKAVVNELTPAAADALSDGRERSEGRLKRTSA